MLLDQVRTEGRVQGVGVRPPEHLVLQQRVVNAVEEFAKTSQQVALGNDEVNGKPHVQGALDDIKLLGNSAGLLGDLIGRVADQALNREHEEEAVDGALRTRPFEQAQELAPLGRLARDAPSTASS